MGDSVASDKRPSTPHKDRFKSQSNSEAEVESLLINEMLSIWASFIYSSLWEIDTRLALPL